MTEKQYIAAYGNVSPQDVPALIGKYWSEGCTVYAMYADKLECTAESDSPDAEKALEIRVFNETMELRIVRDSVYADYQYRLIDDAVFRERLQSEAEFENHILTEDQYLDVDETKSGGGGYTATGGGYYTLPFAGAEKIRICNYLDYDEDGIACFADFRLVKILRKEE